LLGALQWLVTQTKLDCNVDVNLIQSEIVTATVGTLLAANKILRKMRQTEVKLITKKIDGEIQFLCWSDASWANRKNFSSTGGYLIGIGGKDISEGARGHVSIVSWSSNKLRRVARSSLAAELQALANAEDELHLVRASWAELNGEPFEAARADEIVKTVPGIVIIDAKSIYDTLTSRNQPLQLQEKRTALELLAYLKNTQKNGTETRWVHGGANLGDGLTKLGAGAMLREFIVTGTWALVQYQKQQSFKKRRAAGMDSMANRKEDNFSALAKLKMEEVWPGVYGQDQEDSEDE
jgi:hypothetical protein